MADLGDYYSGAGAMTGARPTQAPQGASPSVSGNIGVSGGIGAANVDVLGAIVLLGIALFILHLE